jgi:hypothetical protein
VTNIFNGAIMCTIPVCDLVPVARVPGTGVRDGELMRGESSDDNTPGDAGNEDTIGGTGRIDDDPATGPDGRSRGDGLSS